MVKKDNFFLLSSESIKELEHIKTNKNKTDELRYSARKAVRFLDSHQDNYKIIVYDASSSCDFSEFGLEDSPDNRIIRCALYAKDVLEYKDLTFVSNDILCRLIATTYFGLNAAALFDNHDDVYTGYIEKILTEPEMAYFYEHIQENIFGLLTNQYIIIKNENNDIVDTLKWDGYEYRNLKFPNIKSNYFGSVKPYNGDIYQQMVLNSLSTNQVTMIKGPAGTGKSYLALGYLLWLLEKRKIEKIIVFCNTVATLNSAKLGYYPGSKNEKLLDSAIGNMLSAKLGDSFGLEQMVAQGKILLLPLSDIRGFDTHGMNAGVYITEAQNMDISLMKLALQRISEDSICIIDGDYHAQVDLAQYAGDNNGMKRMSEVFRGYDFYGEVELKNIYRSRIAKIAEKM